MKSFGVEALLQVNEGRVRDFTVTERFCVSEGGSLCSYIRSFTVIMDLRLLQVLPQYLAQRLSKPLFILCMTV